MNIKLTDDNICFRTDKELAMNGNMKNWIEALRSGEYSQAKGQLREEDSYCCLGVACNIYHKETGLGKWLRDYNFETNQYDLETALDDEIREWLGLTEDKELTYMYLNDNNHNFFEIADEIEKDHTL